jgi:hypothetical protein
LPAKSFRDGRNLGATPRPGLFAIEEALRLRDKLGAEVTILTMGPPMAEDTLRKALTFGADRAVLLTERFFAGSDTLATTFALSTAIAKMDFTPTTLGGISCVAALHIAPPSHSTTRRYATQSQSFFLTYPQLVSRAMQNFVRVDGTPKVEKEKTTVRSFVAARSWFGLFADGFRFARAWR